MGEKETQREKECVRKTLKERESEWVRKRLKERDSK